MDDLISRQAVIDLLKKNTTRDIEEVVVTEKNIKLIMDMPKAYDVDAVVKQLEEARKIAYNTYKNYELNVDLGRAFGVENAIEIVNKLAEEYKLSEMPTGWIPCSSGYFSTSEVLVCKVDGTIDFDVYDFMDNDWKFNSNHHKNKVVAWQPLPAPYTEGE